uniref:Uncharacterized protein n=1 Tax=Vespula pensylvanica TaxID=30213 RepID=A0A834P7U4_VESPE|nr:hypothetical protein H0235_004601 [Vespula pensylvanica]
MTLKSDSRVSLLVITLTLACLPPASTPIECGTQTKIERKKVEPPGNDIREGLFWLILALACEISYECMNKLNKQICGRPIFFKEC